VTKTKLPAEVVRVCKNIINATEDGSCGYDAAVNQVSEQWELFEKAGAVVNNMDEICAYIKWAKCEGFHERQPLK
jgi:hypothetical protein